MSLPSYVGIDPGETLRHRLLVRASTDTGASATDD